MPGEEPEGGETTVTTLRQSGTTTPLVARSAWQGVAEYGPCTLSQSTDPGGVDPRADQYGVSQSFSPRSESPTRGLTHRRCGTSCFR